MIKTRAVLIFVLAIIAIATATALEYDLSYPSLDFKEVNQKLVIIETETDPLLISYSLTGDIKKFIKVSPNQQRVSRSNPLILTMDATNPGKQLKGTIILDFLYETLPKTTADYSDNTIIIPITINSRDSPNKLYINLKDAEPKESEAVSLGADIALPILIMLTLLIVFKRKWQK